MKDNEMSGTDGQKNTQGNSLFDSLLETEPEAPRDLVEFHVLSALSVYRDDLDKANARGDWWKKKAEELAQQVQELENSIEDISCYDYRATED